MRFCAFTPFRKIDHNSYIRRKNAFFNSFSDKIFRPVNRKMEKARRFILPYGKQKAERAFYIKCNCKIMELLCYGNLFDIAGARAKYLLEIFYRNLLHYDGKRPVIQKFDLHIRSEPSGLDDAYTFP